MSKPIQIVAQLKSTALITVLCLLVASGCSVAPTDDVSLTTFPYTMDDPSVGTESHPRLLIAHVNLGKPSRKYLRPYESRVDGFVRDKLKSAGFKIVSGAVFEDEWTNAVRRFGNPFNTSTGKINEKAFTNVLQYVFAALRERGTVDAVVFTDLIEREVSYGSSINRVVRFDGVTRKLHTVGPGSGVPTGFNWGQAVQAVTIWANVFDMNARTVFQGGGGIEVTQALSLKSTPKFVRRRSVLANKSTIEEGVSLAFHPFVEMKKYPGRPAAALSEKLAPDDNAQ